MPRLTKDVKQVAQQLGIRTTQKQKGLFDDPPRNKAKPKVYVEAEFIKEYRKQRNIVLKGLYPYLNINEQGEMT